MKIWNSINGWRRRKIWQCSAGLLALWLVLAGSAAAQEPADPGLEEDDFLQMLEFLGEWEREGEGWTDPLEADELLQSSGEVEDDQHEGQ